MLIRNKSIRKLARAAAGRVPVAATLLDYAAFRASHGTSAALSEGDTLRELRRDGFVLIPGYMGREDREQCIADFEWMLANKPQFVRKVSDSRVFGAEVFSDSIMRFAADESLADLSETFLGAEAVNAFTLANRVDPVPGSRGSGEGWHKDAFFRQFKAFVYLNDVDENNGPFQFIAGSHTLADYIDSIRVAGLGYRNLVISDAQVERILEREPGRLRTVTAAAGALFLVNTAVIHRGCPPVSGVRYALTNYYVEYDQISAAWIDRYQPVSPDKVLSMKKNWHLRRRIQRETVSR